MIYRRFMVVCLSLLGWLSQFSYAQEKYTDQLVQINSIAVSESVPIVVTSNHPAAIKYVFLAMPGKSGQLTFQSIEGKLQINLSDNFLIRSRGLFVDEQTIFVAVSTTSNPERMHAVFSNLKVQYPQAKIFLISTSQSTLDSMRLALAMDGQFDGVIHTASFESISSLDTRQLKTPQLLVHHVHDECRFTPFASAKRNRDVFGTALIEIEGGTSTGEACQSMSYHGFNGVEKHVVSQIKEWARQVSR